MAARKCGSSSRRSPSRRDPIPRRLAEVLEMWLNVVALLLLGVFIGIGCLRGALATFIGLAAFVLGYAAAIAAAPSLAAQLPSSSNLPGIVGIALAGCLVFAVVYALVMIAGKLVRRAQGDSGNEGRSVRDRFLGGVFG